MFQVATAIDEVNVESLVPDAQVPLNSMEAKFMKMENLITSMSGPRDLSAKKDILEVFAQLGRFVVSNSSSTKGLKIFGVRQVN